MLCQDQVVFLQFHVMITHRFGHSFGFAPTIFRILDELANLLPEIS
jgi:hypothetical protein